jgi:hypothetical protein
VNHIDQQCDAGDIAAGRLKLATSPNLMGSSPLVKTMGTVVVTTFAASAAGG